MSLPTHPAAAYPASLSFAPDPADHPEAQIMTSQNSDTATSAATLNLSLAPGAALQAQIAALKATVEAEIADAKAGFETAAAALVADLNVKIQATHSALASQIGSLESQAQTLIALIP